MIEVAQAAGKKKIPDFDSSESVVVCRTPESYAPGKQARALPLSEIRSDFSIW
jgi:hypothetical protein